jgi:hypothetical protein
LRAFRSKAMAVMRSAPAADATQAQEAFGEALWSLTLEARRAAFAHGAKFAAEQASEAGYQVPDIPAPGYSPDSVRTVLRENWRGPEPWETTIDRLEGHVRDASRQAVITMATVLSEPEPAVSDEDDWSDLDEELTPLEFRPRPNGVVGWARVLGANENHCALCVMGASRGPVYATAEAAGRMSAAQKWADASGFVNRYHDHCKCDVVLVTKGARWEGREQQAAMERLYEEAAKRAAKNHPGMPNGKTYATNYILKEIDAILRERASAGNPVEIPAYAA